MFDLDQAIAEWRRRLRAAGIKSPEALTELEAHLREDINVLVSRGAASDEALQQAVSRAGNPGLLAAEFRKGFRRGASLRVTAGWVARLAASLALIILLLCRSWDGKLGLLLLTHTLFLTAGYGAAFLTGGWGVYYVCGRHFRILSPAAEQMLSRVADRSRSLAAGLVVVGVVLGVLWSRLNWGRSGAGDPREIGGIIAAIWLVAAWMIPRFGSASQRTAALLGILGNIIVGLAWFGAGSLAHGYGVLSYRPLDGWLMGHCLVLVMAILPSARTAEA